MTSWLDRWIPGRLMADQVEHTRARWVVSIMTIHVVMSVAFGTLWLSLGHPYWRQNYAMALAVALLLLSRLWGSVTGRAHLALGMLYLQLWDILLTRDTLMFSTLFELLIIPIVMVFIGGVRAALGWSVAVVGTVVAVVWLTLHRHWWVVDPIPMLPMVTSAFVIVLVAVLAVATSHARLVEQLVAQLQASRVQAEAAARFKSDFLASMSHEIRTPMTGVLGMLDALRDEPLTPDQREQVDIAARSGQILLGVINDILDFSKLEAGKLPLEILDVDVVGIARELAALLAQQAAQRGNQIVVEGPPSLWVKGDPVRLRQILLNLLSNANKFTSGGEVRVRLEREEGAGVRLAVRDSGIGMSQEQIARLFRPFEQAEASTARRFGGTGLGLAIVRYLVEAMGGRVRVESEAGQGSTFTVGLPLEEGRPPAAAPSDAPLRLRRLRVLVADDNPINQRVIARVLHRLGMEVHLVEDGRAALEACMSAAGGGGFEVVLMDCQMPGMDGWEATRRLRALGVTTPIWALTAGVTAEERQACADAGMDGVLAKPLQQAALVDALARVA